MKRTEQFIIKYKNILLNFFSQIPFIVPGFFTGFGQFKDLLFNADLIPEYVCSYS